MPWINLLLRFSNEQVFFSLFFMSIDFTLRALRATAPYFYALKIYGTILPKINRFLCLYFTID